MRHARSMTRHGVLSLGIAAAIGPERAAALAPRVEAAGFHALWVNDTPGADALAVLEAAAGVTSTLTLATGVVPIDRRSPDEIARRVAALPAHRLVIGIGSGGIGTGALARIGAAVADLRASTAVRVMVGALGPRMRHLAAAEADGPLLSWLDPATARAQADAAHAVAAEAHVALYVRAALEPGARERLRAETARYAGLPSYAANFARLGLDPDDTVLDAAAPGFTSRLEAYRGAVDEVVLRAITPADGAADDRAFVDRAADLIG